MARGIDRSRLNCVGLAGSSRVADDTEGAGDASNRRVEIHLADEDLIPLTPIPLPRNKNPNPAMLGCFCFAMPSCRRARASRLLASVRGACRRLRRRTVPAAESQPRSHKRAGHTLLFLI